MRKFLMLMLSVLLILPISSAYAQDGTFEPLSPAFIKWQAQHSNSSPLRNNYALPEGESSSGGLIPIPVDLSHLADNPPQENTSPVRLNKAAALPSTYDLRNVNGTSYVTSIKSQLPYGTCWAFSAIGAMESNFMRQGYSALDLSEMHTAWYSFRNSDKSKAFNNVHNSSFYDVLNHGGNSFYIAALYSRLAGPVLESDVPYGVDLQPSAATPESYTRVLRLRDVYYLSMSNYNNINASTSQRDIIKQRIIDNGAVVANYYNDNSKYNVTDSGGTAYYDTTKGEGNHAVLIVGWDDNYSRSNFKTKPSIDGAWLIKNSWGEQWTVTGGERVGDDGYFWISYATYFDEGSAFIVEEADPDMQAYYYDSLGWCGTFGYSTSNIYAANVFKAERDSEKLTEVGFYTADNNTKYEITIYTGLGTSMPSSNPTGGTKALTQSGTMPYAGWHAVKLDEAVPLTKDNYFSVVVKFTGKKTTPIEMKIEGFSDNAAIEEGSFFSPNGTYWESSSNVSANATVKAFTVTGTPAAGTSPKITTDYPPDGSLNTPYSSVLNASGTQPIAWSITSSRLPYGLALDSATGTISGTPTTVEQCTFRVTASNEYGSDSKYFTMNIWDIPTIITTSFTGYVGFAFSEQLELSTNDSAEWTASRGLPAGLKIDPATGAISGKPTKAGNYTATISATSSAGVSTAVVSFTINAKPVKASITTSSLKAGEIGEEYSQTVKFRGTEPVTLIADGVPNGLTFDTSTGLLFGTPAEAGNFTIKITASNIVNTLDGSSPATKNVKLTIKAQAPKIAAPSALADGIVNTEYSSVQFTASQGTEPITWTASGLPSGLTLSTAGLLSGTPKKAGNFKLTIKAKNSGGQDSVKLALTVFMMPEITTKKLSAATTDKTYSARITAKGTAPISWDIQGLPDTLTFTPIGTGASIQLKGTPTEAGTYSLKVKAWNIAGTDSADFTLTVKGVAATITASLAKGTVNSAYNETRITAKGTKPINITCSISDADKAKHGINSLADIGLTFTTDSATGTATLSGTPTKSVKNLPLTFTAENIASTKPASRKVSLTIAGQKPIFTSPADATTTLLCEQNAYIAVDFTVTGTENITYSINKVNGFTITQTGTHTATLSGTAPAKDGKTTITVTAANADGKATRKVIVQTMTKPSITTTSLKAGTLNKSYSDTLKASGTKKITWSVTGTLPAGLSFNANNGALKGKPTQEGSYTLTFTATNDIGTDSKTLTLTVGNQAANNGSLETWTTSPAGDEKHETAQTEQRETVIIDDEEYPVLRLEGEQLRSLMFRLQDVVLAEEGCTIAAELGEITAEESGMHDFDVELTESADVGAKLYWFAYPVDAEDSDDDEIAEFFDEEGAEIDAVPESRKIIVSVWLREGVTYKPVIAVK